MRWVAPGQCQGNGVRTVSKQMVNGMMGNSRQFDFEASTDFQFFVER